MYHNLGAKEKDAHFCVLRRTVSAPKSSPAAIVADPVPRLMSLCLGELEGEG